MNPTTTAICSPRDASPGGGRRTAAWPDPTCPGRWRGRPKARCRPDAVLTQARSGAALAGELLDLVHDPLVHDAATHALGQARVDVLDVDRGADPHGHRPALRQEAGEHVLGVLQTDGHHGAARLEREPGRALLARVQQPVLGAGALGVDREAVPLTQDLRTGLECALAGGERLTVHRD